RAIVEVGQQSGPQVERVDLVAIVRQVNVASQPIHLVVYRDFIGAQVNAVKEQRVNADEKEQAFADPSLANLSQTGDKVAKHPRKNVVCHGILSRGARWGMFAWRGSRHSFTPVGSRNAGPSWSIVPAGRYGVQPKQSCTQL